MGRKLSCIVLILPLLLFAGCGEQADKKDFIDAPEVSTSSTDSMKERGLTPEQIESESSTPDQKGK